VSPSSFVDPPAAARTRPGSGAGGDADCELRFGSWTLDADLLRLQPVHDRFEPPIRRHPDWDVVRTPTPKILGKICILVIVLLF